MSKLEGKVIIAQGGGPTAVINQSLVGAVLESRKFPQITRVYGALYGVQGIRDEKFVDLTQATTHNLEMVARTPSSALMSTRDKPDTNYCQQMFEVMRRHDVRYFFYIGGNDSADTTRIVNEMANHVGYELRCIHIPKTIDNDIPITDHTPGYGSAARFVASAFAGVNLDNRALPGVYIGVVMGRHAGFLTAASALAQKYEDDGPHLIHLPERRFNLELFLDEVKAIYCRHGRCIVAVSEGIWTEMDQKGKPKPMIVSIYEKMGWEVPRDPHGNVLLSGGGLADTLTNLVKDKLGISRVRGDTFGYLQRSFLGCVSENDRNEAREVGEKAAQFACWHNVDGSICIRRTGDYSVEYFLEQDLTKIAGQTRVMPDEYINKNGNHVTEKFRWYAGPLISPLDDHPLERLWAPPPGRIPSAGFPLHS